jgi:hypothetical protein
MSIFRRGPSHLQRQLAEAGLETAIGRAERAVPAPVRLEVGTRITAVTEGGTAVEGIVGRIYQAPRDVAAGVFRFACEPAGDDGRAAS